MEDLPLELLESVLNYASASSRVKATLSYWLSFRLVSKHLQWAVSVCRLWRDITHSYSWKLRSSVPGEVISMAKDPSSSRRIYALLRVTAPIETRAGDQLLTITDGEVSCAVELTAHVYSITADISKSDSTLYGVGDLGVVTVSLQGQVELLFEVSTRFHPKDYAQSLAVWQNLFYYINKTLYSTYFAVYNLDADDTNNGSRIYSGNSVIRMWCSRLGKLFVLRNAQVSVECKIRNSINEYCPKAAEFPDRICYALTDDKDSMYGICDAGNYDKLMKIHAQHNSAITIETTGASDMVGKVKHVEAHGNRLVAGFVQWTSQKGAKSKKKVVCTTHFWELDFEEASEILYEKRMRQEKENREDLASKRTMFGDSDSDEY